MTGTQDIVFAPLVPVLALWVLAGLAAAMVALALWQGLRGWWLRGLAALAVLAALANPSLQNETREPLSDIALVLVDDTASNRIGDATRRPKRPLPIWKARLRIWQWIRASSPSQTMQVTLAHS